MKNAIFAGLAYALLMGGGCLQTGCSQMRPLGEVMADLNTNVTATVTHGADAAVSGTKSVVNVVEAIASLATGPLAGMLPGAEE